MKTRTRLYGWVFAFLMTANSALAAGPFHLLDFRLAGLAALQGSGSTFSGSLDWNPSYWFSDSFGLVGNFGATVLNQSAGGLNAAATTFWAPEYELFAAYKAAEPLTLELGGGAQTWLLTNPSGSATTASSSTYAMGTFNAHYLLSGKPLFIESVFAGYSAVLAPTIAHEVRAGVQIGF